MDVSDIEHNLCSCCRQFCLQGSCRNVVTMALHLLQTFPTTVTRHRKKAAFLFCHKNVERNKRREEASMQRQEGFNWLSTYRNVACPCSCQEAGTGAPAKLLTISKFPLSSCMSTHFFLQEECEIVMWIGVVQSPKGSEEDSHRYWWNLEISLIGKGLCALR